MLVDDFDYFLPPELIAQTPAAARDGSRLMTLDATRKTITHGHFYDLPEFLREGDALIFNDTRVIPARLMGKKDKTGGRAEVFLLRRLDSCRWETLVKPGKKLGEGAKIVFGEELSCTVEARTDFGGRVVKFSYDGIFEEILDRLGKIPLPPYIHEELADRERYQTVYSREKGSAAAPTAGLHFTEELLAKLKNQGVNLGFVTLHVGLGTFRPVNVETVEDHVMHGEWFSLPEETARLINDTKAAGKRVVAVGTTTVRTLETAAAKEYPLKGASGVTNIFIYPGFNYKVVDALVTNFHLPKSTLIMLVSAFAGREFVLEAYKEAVREKYRFFSFGDAMFLHR